MDDTGKVRNHVYQHVHYPRDLFAPVRFHRCARYALAARSVCAPPWQSDVYSCYLLRTLEDDVTAHRPFSAEWAEAFRAAIEADAVYREAATKWTWPVALVLQAAPEYGYDTPVAVELTLERGRCHAAVIKSPDTITAPFVLTAPYAVWKAVVQGELDPLVGVTRGKIAVRGSLATLMMHAKSAAALCACARHVATAFPDED